MDNPFSVSCGKKKKKKDGLWAKGHISVMNEGNKAIFFFPPNFNLSKFIFFMVDLSSSFWIFR